jgi:hypothetical protein
MSFQFVENGKIDGAARKLIRSHVMKGKNVGKIRPRRTPKVQREPSLSHDGYAASLSIGISCRSPEDSKDTVISVPQTIGNSLSYFAFPCQLQPHMRDLIYQCMDKVPLHSCLSLLNLFSHFRHHPDTSPYRLLSSGRHYEIDLVSVPPE